jgi:hypothetical protein
VKAVLVKMALIDEKGCKKGSKLHPFAPSLVSEKSGNSFGMNGGDDETRTRDLCRDSGPVIGFTTTYKTAGTAKSRVSR